MKTPRLGRRRRFALATAFAAASLVTTTASVQATSAGAAAAPPRLDHVVIVMEENKDYSEIIGRPDEAPYINDLATRSALFTNSFGVTHPSQPNYIALFSGSTQGVTSDDCPQNFTNVPNLGSDLIGAGDSFAGYAEDLDGQGSTDCGDHWYWPFGYARKHVPWVDFNNVPSTSNKTWDQFPSDYSQLPTVSFVIPDLCDDMHSCGRDSGDSWLSDNLGAYATWAESHNSLLIVTWDEDDDANNLIPTIIHGAHVQPGTYGEFIDHYSVLRTVETMYGLPVRGTAGSRSPITDIWN
jgi:acid phosphatase